MLRKILILSKKIDQSVVYRLKENINVNKELCLEAVKQNGYSLVFVPWELRDKEICFEAVKKNGRALIFVPKEVKDREICLEAVKKNGYLLRFVPLKLEEYVKQNLGLV
jgi:hypothetical protein